MSPPGERSGSTRGPVDHRSSNAGGRDSGQRGSASGATTGARLSGSGQGVPRTSGSSPAAGTRGGVNEKMSYSNTVKKNSVSYADM